MAISGAIVLTFGYVVALFIPKLSSLIRGHSFKKNCKSAIQVEETQYTIGAIAREILNALRSSNPNDWNKTYISHSQNRGYSYFEYRHPKYPFTIGRRFSSSRGVVVVEEKSIYFNPSEIKAIKAELEKIDQVTIKAQREVEAQRIARNIKELFPNAVKDA
jgi:hypothetical protein